MKTSTARCFVPVMSSRCSGRIFPAAIAWGIILPAAWPQRLSVSGGTISASARPMYAAMSQPSVS